MRTSAQHHSPSSPPAPHRLPGSTKREQLNSGVRDVAARVRSTSSPAAATDANPFAWLETETTRAHQVSDELLKLTRENAALANGATKSFEIPTDLLQLARGKREARIAAGLPVSLPAPAAPPASAAPSATASATPSATDPKSSPDIMLSELSDEERAWVEGSMTAQKQWPRDVVQSLESLVPRPLQTASATASIPWLLVSLWLVAISVFVFS